MIRKDKNGLYCVECSNCKAPASAGHSGEDTALVWAEMDYGFAVSGKFHFCPSCFDDMLERWKSNNRDAVRKGAG